MRRPYGGRWGHSASSVHPHVVQNGMDYFPSALCFQLVHDLQHCLVVGVSQLDVDVGLQEGLDDLQFAAQSSLVKSRSSRGPGIDVEAGMQDQVHDIALIK